MRPSGPRGNTSSLGKGFSDQVDRGVIHPQFEMDCETRLTEEVLTRGYAGTEGFQRKRKLTLGLQVSWETNGMTRRHAEQHCSSNQIMHAKGLLVATGFWMQCLPLGGLAFFLLQCLPLGGLTFLAGRQGNQESSEVGGWPSPMPGMVQLEQVHVQLCTLEPAPPGLSLALSTGQLSHGRCPQERKSVRLRRVCTAHSKDKRQKKKEEKNAEQA